VLTKQLNIASICYNVILGAVMVVIVWQLNLWLPMQ